MKNEKIQALLRCLSDITEKDIVALTPEELDGVLNSTVQVTIWLSKRISQVNIERYDLMVAEDLKRDMGFFWG
jgi:hypothetical protein